MESRNSWLTAILHSIDFVDSTVRDFGITPVYLGKTINVAYAPISDSHQPWHMPNLIRVFAVLSKDSKKCKLSTGQQRLRIE